MKKEKLKSELKRIRSWNIYPNNIFTDVIETCKDKDGGYILSLQNRRITDCFLELQQEARGEWKRILV